MYLSLYLFLGIVTGIILALATGSPQSTLWCALAVASATALALCALLHAVKSSSQITTTSFGLVPSSSSSSSGSTLTAVRQPIAKLGATALGIVTIAYLALAWNAVKHKTNVGTLVLTLPPLIMLSLAALLNSFPTFLTFLYPTPADIALHCHPSFSFNDTKTIVTDNNSVLSAIDVKALNDDDLGAASSEGERCMEKCTEKGTASRSEEAPGFFAV
jgi:hypothetical protein